MPRRPSAIIAKPPACRLCQRCGARFKGARFKGERYAAIYFDCSPHNAHAPKTALAHCDTPAGPAITAVKKALENKNLNLVMIWLQPKDEKEIDELFRQVQIVRTQSKEAQTLADQYFYENVVRLHRMGEGECYEGIKQIPSGNDFINEVKPL